MSAKLENKASSATLVDPSSTSHTYRHETAPALPERAAGRVRGDSETHKELKIEEVTSPASSPGPLSASFNPNAASPGVISSLPTPPTLSFASAAATDLISSLPPHPSGQGIPQPPSPFSASFDTNGARSHTTPTTRQLHALHPRMSASSLASSTGSIHVAQEQWNHIMSSSLSALASQFQAASQVIASSSASVSDGAYNERSSASYSDAAPEQEEAASEVSDLALARSSVNPLGVETMLSLMMSRLENVERNQVRLSGELESVRVELAELKHSGRGFDGGEPTSVEKVTEDAGYFPRQEGKMKETEIVEVSRSDEPQQPPEAEVQKRVEALETNVLSILETLKVEQARLYPRLQNAAVTLNKQAIKPLPVQGTGKAPINFPATKGEFEHLTKERYEALLKSYGLPVKGDTAAKREAVREYIGLTQPGK